MGVLLSLIEQCNSAKGNEYKICSICNKRLPATIEYFYKNASSKDGLFPYCKSCNISKSQKWAKSNYKHVKKMKKLWHQREENRTRNNLRDKTWRINNEKRKQQYQSQYLKQNKDKVKRYNQNHSSHDITREEWESCLNYFNYSCAYCQIHQDQAKVEYGNYLHKEHVDHMGANDLSNCVPACKSCNSQKWVHSFEKWYNPNNITYSKDRYDKIIKWLTRDYCKFIKTTK